jgi:uncharacterized membrane protein
MSEPRHGWTEHQVEMVVGALLRVGVLTSAAVVLLGAVLFLAQEGNKVVRLDKTDIDLPSAVKESEGPDYGTFHGEPPDLEHLGTIFRGAARLEGRYVIQLGILLLVATPVARVVLCVFAFAWQRDRFYVAVTLFVLAVLLASLAGLGGH